VIAKSTTPNQVRKRERTATAAYPYHPLQLCVDIGAAVREIGNGKSEVSTSMLAARLKVPEVSGDFTTKLVSAKRYGIIEGKTSFTLTAAAKRYFFPTKDPASEKRAALLGFFASPEAFSRLIELYDGSRLDLEIMGNMLHQEMGIPDSWKSRIAKFFVRSAEFVGAIDSSGILRFRANSEGLNDYSSLSSHSINQDDDAIDEPEDRTDRPVKERRRDIVRDVDDSPEGIVVWSYPCEGRKLRIETPENITMDTWQKLNRYMQVIKPE
jgi:hypothetical protein